MLLKTKLLAALAAFLFLLSLGGSGYAAKHWFDKNYVLLNEEEQAALSLQVEMYARSAYMAGMNGCKNSL